MKYQNFYTIIILLVLSLSSCHNIPKNVKRTLELSGNNKVELQKVIDHYQMPEDSLKLKAAYFLIGNMANKFSFDTLAIGPHREFIGVLNSVHSIPIEKRLKMKGWDAYSQDWHTYFKDSIWKSLESKYGKFDLKNALSQIRDVDVITSKLLIENIDLAFKVWREKPWAQHVGFDDFCEYILPYRVAHEPLNNWRLKLYEKYSWIDSLFPEKGSVIDAARMLNDSIKWFKHNEQFLEYPDLGISDLYKARYGICTDQNNLANYVLRSQGVPVIHVAKNKGTSWSAILDTDGKLVEFDGAFDEPKKHIGYFQEHMESESYRTTILLAHSFLADEYPFYDRKSEDVPPGILVYGMKNVTKISQASSSKIKLSHSKLYSDKFKHVYLCRFLSKGIGAVDWFVNKGNSLITSNTVMTNQIYIPMFYKRPEYTQAAYPIYLTKKGNIIKLKPNIKSLKKVKLYRKHGMGTSETKYAKLMVGTKFQASNDRRFKNPTTLHTVSHYPKHAMEIYLTARDKFRYVRYVSNPKTRIAEIGFYSKERKKMIGNHFTSNDSLLLPHAANVFDGDIRTNFGNDRLPNGWWLAMDFEKPIEIESIKYLFQNSFNTIESGHEYELLYWDKEWKSLGVKKAEDDFIEYEIPDNAVLRLKNLTTGNDQQVFFIKEGKQIWG